MLSNMLWLGYVNMARKYAIWNLELTCSHFTILRAWYRTDSLPRYGDIAERIWLIKGFIICPRIFLLIFLINPLCLHVIMWSLSDSGAKSFVSINTKTCHCLKWGIPYTCAIQINTQYLLDVTHMATHHHFPVGSPQALNVLCSFSSSSSIFGVDMIIWETL